MQIDALPAFTDNYIWLLRMDDAAVVVDPGDASVVIDHLRRHGLHLLAILLTHHHADHTGGVAALRAYSSQSGHALDIYGPAAESHRIPTINRPLRDGDTIELPGLRLRILAVPGHTLGHIAYYGVAGVGLLDDGAPVDTDRADRKPDAVAVAATGVLFCGDTLFSAGCGRLFEGTPAQMHASLQRLAGLPDTTRVYCTHEYTVSNLQFALAVEPGNPRLVAHAERVFALRSVGRPTLPSRLALEKAINPFLRCREPAIIAAASTHAGEALDGEVAVFTELRAWKDHFRPT